MLERRSFKNIYKEDISVSYDTSCECPLCRTSLIPIVYGGSIDKHNGKNQLSLHCGCTKCGGSFLIRYDIESYSSKLSKNVYYGTKLSSLEPSTYDQLSFGDNIEGLSPYFVKIYNQAYFADQHSLDEICGIGYRKSLEFLIKDFAIYKHQDEKETIKSMNLSSCINKYIDDSRIKSLAIASAWLGNDETHYIRKHEDYDVNNLKSFIKLIVNFINQELEIDKANSLISRVR